MKIGITLSLLASLTLSLGVLSGCATLSQEECLMGNWEAIGYADGAAGRTPERLTSHNKACAKAGVAPDYQAWERGRQKGLKQYCTETNAYQIGKRGSQMNAVCPADIAPRLQRINADGRQYYALTRQLAEEEKQLEEYQEEFKKLRDGDNLSFGNERDARAYLVQLPQKAAIVQARIDSLKDKIADLQQKYGY